MKLSDRPIVKYVSYILRHKWEVYKAGRELGVGFWQLLIHDWPKFSPAEFGPYMAYFNYERTAAVKNQFQHAWNHHQKMCCHHWQYYVLVKADGDHMVLEMPRKYAMEMIADWYGAGRALGKPDIRTWYIDNAKDMLLHPNTRKLVEEHFVIPPTRP